MKYQISDLQVMVRRQLRRVSGKDGRWLAWLMYEVCTPTPGVPPFLAIRWNTRSIESEQIDFYRSAEGSDLQVPIVATSLWQYDVRRWFGEPIILYRTEVYLQAKVAGYPTTFERNRSFSDQSAARADFLKHRGQFTSVIHAPVAQDAT